MNWNLVMSLIKRILSVLIIMILCGVIGYWIYYIVHQSTPTRHHPQTTTPTVTLQPLSYHVIHKTVISYGVTVSPQSTPLRSQVSGTISEIHFTAGQQVKSGQILFTLLSSDIGNQSKKLFAQMQSSKSIYKRQAQANKLFPGTIDANTVETSKLRYEQDKAAYLESRIVEHVRAPSNGIISDTNLAVGSYVDAGEQLANFVDPRSVQIKYELPAKFVSQLHTGQTVKFYPSSSLKPLTANVAYIAPLFNTDNYNLTLRANLQIPQPLKQNEFGKVVQVLNEHYKILALPQKIVQTDASGFYAFSIDDHKITKLYFTPGEITKTGLIEVVSGIKPQTPLVTSDVLQLTPGQTVQVAHQ